MGKRIFNFLGDELSFLKLGSHLICLTGGCQIFHERQLSQIAVSEVKCVFWPVD